MYVCMNSSMKSVMAHEYSETMAMTDVPCTSSATEKWHFVTLPILASKEDFMEHSLMTRQPFDL